MNESSVSERCGYVAIVGRPNVGKSTLLNYILGQKLSITSRKPQTTQHTLLGIKTSDGIQTVYVDTPGIHGDAKKAINRYMNRNARSVLRDVDVVVFVTDRTEWQSDDEITAEAIKLSKAPVIVVINKVDLLKDKSVLLPQLQMLQARLPNAEIIPVSATHGDNLKTLEALIEAKLPAGPFMFPDDQVTDRSERFLVAEIIREKIVRQLGEEIPYAATIQIERFVTEGKILHIDALILVERDGQKAIIIGKGGARLKRIGSEARQDIESLLENKVMLKLWVKVKSGWSDDERALKSLGYDDI
ncbi:MAG: GTPase Era [Pseudomonadales bacterium]|jgi:GTPase|nr:GTPase Era [Pseudomonadales bacterium]MDP4640351.1 GTPase Era [Pseudomonadales bacterium]MDP4765492.1 GTPase Era [Pseudomonadales bacterium]MDP4910992.1 GTPase Era [Pseudomonadales bacterium]MDP5059052.1 GTPase Era [Pseudomonadales bacterium]